ncbi:MAG: hypothetical protein NTW74_23740 [Acidobacteria bacterium]|nr:hypothetical protein [Acidobacteriota bacterium]
MNRSYLYHASRQPLPGHLGTAVSLHSHTSRSRETMSFIPRYVTKVPYMTGRIRHLEAAYLDYHGKPFDYSRVWWTPPLEPKAAFDLERNQIEQKLGRAALVSLSDHDNVDAGFALEIFEECAGAPISSEWTVPLGQAILQLGIHNMQPARARMQEETMKQVTANPTTDRIEAMLDILHSFLARHGRYIHALELNGLRSPKENNDVVQLAEVWGLPLISGGDRHGCEPNALVNLTSATTFKDFVAEIRNGAPTHTVYMEQYDEPIRLRVLQVMSDVLRTYNNFSADRRRWSDRVFYHCEDETIRRVSDVWTGNGPDIVGQFISAMRLLESRHVRAVLKLALAT